MNKPWFRKSDGHWYVTISGKQHKLGADEHGAKRKHPPDPIVEEWHRLEKVGSKPDITYRELAKLYIETVKYPKTRKDTEQQLNWFVAYIENMKVSKMRVHHITAYLETKKTWSTTSQACAIERIVRVLNWGVEQGIIEGHKVQFKTGQKPRRKRRKVVVSDEHATLIENAAYPRLRAILRVLRLTGARPSELCKATIDKADLNHGVLYVLNKTREKTEVEYRPLYLPDEAIAIVRDEIGERTEGSIFRHVGGGAFSFRGLSLQVRHLRRKLGLPENIVPYAYRHTFASNAINRKNVNPAHVAKLLGHVGLDQLKVYYHEDADAMREAIKKATGE